MRKEHGFTLIEVLAASLILVVGIMGTISLVDGANVTSASIKAREGGTNLQRELVEIARTVPYDELTPSGAAAEIRDRGLDDSTVGGSGWTVKRRGVTYTLSIGVCSVDDPQDKTGVEPAGRFCATGTGSLTPVQCKAVVQSGGSSPDCGTDANKDGLADGIVATSQQCPSGCANPVRDQTPDDYKRIVTLVKWDKGSASTRFAIQTATIPNPGFSAGPRVTDLGPALSAPISDAATTSQAFTATVNRQPAKVSFFANGIPLGNASGTGTGPYTLTWVFGDPTTTPDGTFVITAKAVDDYSVAGQSRSVTVQLNRRVPPALTGFVAGWNPRFNTTEFVWNASVEGDLDHYEVFKGPTGTAARVTCGGSPSDTSCYSTSSSDEPAPSGSTMYRVRACDATACGTEVTTTATHTSSPTNAPRNFTASSANGTTTLAWDPPTGPGTVDQYRIYRRPAGATGQPSITARYDYVDGANKAWTDKNTKGQLWVYTITAVNPQLAESPFTGNITK
jgi:prepilin-type N-terminal cleavage/methylation domain-containing protein